MVICQLCVIGSIRTFKITSTVGLQRLIYNYNWEIQKIFFRVSYGICKNILSESSFWYTNSSCHKWGPLGSKVLQRLQSLTKRVFPRFNNEKEIELHLKFPREWRLNIWEISGRGYILSFMCTTMRQYVFFLRTRWWNAHVKQELLTLPECPKSTRILAGFVLHDR
jgi:hypothetical protein